MRTTYCLLALYIWLLSAAAFSVEVIVDNDSGGSQYQQSGKWSKSSKKLPGYMGSYRIAKSSTKRSSATWTPFLPVTDYYSVYAIFRPGTDRSRSAQYTVHHADGTSTVSVDQTVVSDDTFTESLLGVYRFHAGSAGKVVLTNALDGKAVFIADTIRFRSNDSPVIAFGRTAPYYPQAGQPFAVLARVVDSNGVQQVTVAWNASPSGSNGVAAVLDNGAFMDGGSGDGIYGAFLPGFPEGETVSYQMTATDISGAVTTDSVIHKVIGYVPDCQVRVNEILSGNGGSSFDPDFSESGDWIELYNTGPDVADLTSHTLSDSAGNVQKWKFPAGTLIPPASFLQIWCDDHNMSGIALHSNFKLSGSGEAAIVYNAVTSTIVDQVSFPALQDDGSYSRFPDGTGVFSKTVIRTPLAPNMIGERGAMPQFSHASGLYSSAFAVSITAPGATEIRYTTNGAEPTSGSQLYVSPLHIANTVGLRATAFYSTLNPSRPATASYLFHRVPNRTIPVMNLMLNPDDLFDPVRGIYANPHQRGDMWERPGYAVIMNPDGSQVHQSNVGVRINGGTSRGLAKKSFRLYLRGAYGETSWTLPWLARTTAPSFVNLVLRANNNDGILIGSKDYLEQVTFFRDQILRDWHGDSGATGVDGFFFALYINGQYWGLYNACERVTDDYMQSKAGGDEWDVVKGTFDPDLGFHTEVLDGDLNQWNAFLAWLDTNFDAGEGAMIALKERMDYPGFLKYFALNIICQNIDWPHNNWIATRRRGDPTARWTFHQNDGEWSLDLHGGGYSGDTLASAQGMNQFLATRGEIAPLSKLFNGNEFDHFRTTEYYGILDNAQGRRDFVSATEELLNFEFVPASSIGDVNVYFTQIQSEVSREAARWAPNMVSSASQFKQNWPKAVNNVRSFLFNRPVYIRSLIQSRLGLSGTRTVTFHKSGDGNGRLRIYGRTVDLPWSGTFFDTSSLNLEAVPDEGSAFTGWSGAVSGSSEQTTYDVTTGLPVTATLNFADE